MDAIAGIARSTLPVVEWRPPATFPHSINMFERCSKSNDGVVASRSWHAAGRISRLTRRLALQQIGEY